MNDDIQKWFAQIIFRVFFFFVFFFTKKSVNLMMILIKILVYVDLEDKTWIAFRYNEIKMIR